MQKIRLEMTIYLQILLQSHPQLNIYLPQGFEIQVQPPYLDLENLENLDFVQI